MKAKTEKEILLITKCRQLEIMENFINNVDNRDTDKYNTVEEVNKEEEKYKRYEIEIPKLKEEIDKLIGKDRF